MNKYELQQLTQKFLNGTATAAEKQVLHQWYDNNTSGEQVEYVNAETPETGNEVKQRILSRLQEQIVADGNTAVSPAKKPFSIRRILLPAASIAAMLVIVFLVWRPQVKAPVAGGSQLVSETPKKVTKLTLPDGSMVWLNAGSILKFPKSFEGKVRSVELVEGRAFFDIKHMASHPFVVKTRNLNVTVLGTSFDVRSYGREGTTKVSVVTGKVGITLPCSPDKPAIMLVAKQQVVLSKATNNVIKEPVRESVVNLWCKDELVFDQQDLNSVFKAIEKKYNTKITVHNPSLLSERISITLGNQRLDTIMEILSFTKHFNYQMANDSTVVIR